MKVIVRSQSSAKYNITQDSNIVKITQPKSQTIVNRSVDLKNSIKIIQPKEYIQKVIKVEQVIVKIVDSYGNILLDKIDGGIL
jgi:hypothetical protein